MNGIVLIVYAISIAVCAMTLSLSIVNTTFHKTSWGGWFVVFQSCLFATIFLGFLLEVSDVFFGKELGVVFYYIFKIMTHATTGFMLVLLPYFLKYVLNMPWGSLQRTFFYTFGICYFVAGLVSVLLTNNKIAQLIQTPLFIGVYALCIGILWKNLGKIDDEKTRDICLAINIVSLCMIPIAVLSVLFSSVDQFSYPVYGLASSIVLLVYFYLRFDVDADKLEKKTPVNFEALTKFKVTDREETVIELICEGLTNKEIAYKLNISVNTVNNHVANIFEKMGARSRVELLKMMKVGPWD